MTRYPFKTVNVKVIAFIFILLAFVIFGYTRIYNFSLGPKIFIDYPKDKTVVEQPLIEIIGRVERIAQISLNNKKIYANQDNRFSEPLLLVPGYNILRLRAIDTFGRKVEEKLTLFYNEKDNNLRPRPTKNDLEKIEEKEMEEEENNIDEEELSD